MVRVVGTSFIVVGLSLDFIGVVLVIIGNTREGNLLRAWFSPLPERITGARRWTGTGLVLIAIGFAFQIAGVFISS